MKLRYLLLLLGLILTSCSTSGTWNGSRKIDPGQREKESKPGQVHATYKVPGHLHTPGIVALLADVPTNTAVRLAFFSQAPDDRFWTHNAAVVGAWATLFPPAWFYRGRIMNQLHSLHDGNEDAVKHRRELLLDLIKKADIKNEAEHWKIGYLIHAYGDSFAHTFKSTNGTIIAYGPYVGHVLDLKNHPDYISQHIEKYKIYVNTLYQGLGGSSSPDKVKAVSNFLTDVENAALQYPHCADSAEKAVDCVITNRFGVISSDSISKDSKYWKNEITFWKANKFLKQLKKELAK